MDTKNDVKWMDYKDVVAHNEWYAFRETLLFVQLFYGLSRKDALHQLKLSGKYSDEYFKEEL